jgi:hypothetical protein
MDLLSFSFRMLVLYFLSPLSPFKILLEVFFSKENIMIQL